MPAKKMQADILAIGIAFLLGLAARFVGLPPLIGYLLAGFGLFAFGAQMTDTLQEFSEMGVTLLLFTIGLKLQLRNLLMPQIWAVSSLHMVLVVVLASALVLGLASMGLSAFAGMDLATAALISFALSFSSTVFAVKVLEEKGEMYSLYGRISIGILIMQDIAAVVFLAISAGKVPSIWALTLLALLPLRPLLYRVLEKTGHGELQTLFGLTLALGGAQLFELVSVKGDLGALILGILLANHRSASQLARQLLGFKDLFLVGFFLSIGLSGPLSWNAVGIAMLLLLLVPVKVSLFFWLMAKFHLRNRTSLLASLSLANYSEFGLIVAAIGVSNGWLDSEWLIIIAIALSVSFVIAAPLNSGAYRLYSHWRERLSVFESSQRIDEEEAIEPGVSAEVMIFGMGRVGSVAYDVLHERLGDKVLGVDFQRDTVEQLRKEGHQVIHGSATDPDFWERMDFDCNRIKLVMLAMPNVQENNYAVQQLKALGYQGKIAAVAKYPDEIEQLEKVGVHAAFNLFAEAGAGFADHVSDLYE
ncbi:Putative glutathione-regulated potassium-efflux system protein KefB [hydrothermal vent metagenome]|uniref:Glutathione-regulated potassium-efflux system protein KefB n=1 Tax=hydrothermal vent metagenome TaxID=652676 RepID=A0A3B0Z8A6_9ZZZZ